MDFDLTAQLAAIVGAAQQRTLSGPTASDLIPVQPAQPASVAVQYHSSEPSASSSEKRKSKWDDTDDPNKRLNLMGWNQPAATGGFASLPPGMGPPPTPPSQPSMADILAAMGPPPTPRSAPSAADILKTLGPPPQPGASPSMMTAPPLPGAQNPAHHLLKTKMCMFYPQGLCTKLDCTFAHSAAELSPSPDVAASMTKVNTLLEARTVRAQMRKMLEAGGINRGKFPTEGWKCRCGSKNKYWHQVCGGKTQYGCKLPRSEGAISSYYGGNYDPNTARDKPVVSVCLACPFVSNSLQGYHLQAYFQQYGVVTSVKGPMPNDGGAGQRAYIRFEAMKSVQEVMKEGEDHYVIGEEVILVEPGRDDPPKGKGKQQQNVPIMIGGGGMSMGAIQGNENVVMSYGARGLTMNDRSSGASYPYNNL